MLKNVRRYFRYDVNMRFKLLAPEEVSTADERLNSIIEPQTDAVHTKRNLDAFLQKMENSGSKSVSMFKTLETRISFLHWLMVEFAKGANPRKNPSFAQRYKQDKGFSRPNLPSSSHIAPLITGLYDQIDRMIKVLLRVIQKALEHRIFLFPTETFDLFYSKKFISNLSQLAQKEILPAQVLESLIAYFNHQIDAMNLLIEVNRPVSDKDLWPNKEVNLSAGGMAFFTEQQYEQFQLLDCLLDLDGEVLLLRGKLLSQTEVKMGNLKTVIDFQLPTEVEQSRIQLFIQKAELNEAIAWQASQA